MRPKLAVSAPRRRCAWAAALASLLTSALLLATATGRAHAQSLVQGMPSPNGTVSAFATIGNTLYLGGAFDRLGTYTGGGGAFDAATGRVLSGSPKLRALGPSFAYPGGVVTVAIPDGSGGWFVGGDFHSLEGVTRPFVAHVDQSRNVLPWAPPAPNGSVWSLLLSGSTLYVGGDFTAFGGTTRNHIAALDASSGAVSSWNPGADNRVMAFALSGSTLYVSGSFTTLGGASRPNLGAVDVITSATTGWTPNVVGSFVQTITLDVGLAYIGGAFDSVQGIARVNAAAVNLGTGAPTSWAPNANGTVNSLIPSGGSIYAGGAFTSIGGKSRIGVAQLNTTNGNASATWNAASNDYVYQLALSGTTLYAGGAFTAIGGQSRSKIAAIALPTALATSWAPSVDGNVVTVAPSGGAVWLGGLFQRADWVTRRGLASIDLPTRSVSNWNPDVNGSVHALATDGATLYVGGMFSQAGGIARNGLAAYSLPSATPNGFDTHVNQGSAAIPIIYGLCLESGVLRVVGQFDHLGGQLRNHAGAVDPVTAVATTWAPEPNSPVRAIVPIAGGVYLAGGFHTVQGVARDFLVLVDRVTGTPTSWVPPVFAGGFKFGGTLVSANLFSLAEKAGVLYVGGSFQSVASQLRTNFAALDPNGALLPWNVTGVYTADSNIGTMSLDSEGESVLAASTAPISNGFRVLDPSSGASAGWPPELLGAQKVGRAGGYIVVGGDFLDAGSVPSPTLAVFIDPAALAVPSEAGRFARFSLSRPVPNPARRESSVRWTATEPGVFSLRLLDPAGRVVRTLVDRAEFAAGTGAQTFVTAGLAPGIYLLDAETGDTHVSRKLLIVR